MRKGGKNEKGGEVHVGRERGDEGGKKEGCRVMEGDCWEYIVRAYSTLAVIW